mmetsp:Transcript_2359/g.9259  ORF Transcript_2359/g.9259 Transcript_2359/m.9259 type:complete len:244 (+) Transcript_2359:557-1288(+)
MPRSAPSPGHPWAARFRSCGWRMRGPASPAPGTSCPPVVAPWLSWRVRARAHARMLRNTGQGCDGECLRVPVCVSVRVRSPRRSSMFPCSHVTDGPVTLPAHCAAAAPGERHPDGSSSSSPASTVAMRPSPSAAHRCRAASVSSTCTDAASSLSMPSRMAPSLSAKAAAAPSPHADRSLAALTSSNFRSSARRRTRRRWMALTTPRRACSASVSSSTNQRKMIEAGAKSVRLATWRRETTPAA